jgi:threonine dehydrogenase-like Zn-dependent dehydrogenase
MRSLFYDGELRLLELPSPESREGWVRVAVRLSAVTGLDRDVVAGRVPFRGVLGSAFVGTVLEAESERGRDWIGRRVVGRLSWGCGRCEYCAMGSEYRCSDRVRPGLLAAAGSHAEEILLPERAVVAVPNDMPDETAVFAPLLAGIYSILQRAEVPSWTNFLVIGDGGAGLLASIALAAAGYTVTVRGKHGNRFDALRQHNVHFNLVTDEAEIAGLRPGRFGPALVEYPFIVEASGRPSGWQAAVELAMAGATIFMLSSCNDGLPRSLQRLKEKNLHLVGLREGPLSPVLDILAAKLFDPSIAVERVLPLQEGVRAFGRDPNGRGGITLLRVAS